MFTISKEFTFEAAHRLNLVPDGHKCRNLHGHSYRVQIVLQSVSLNECEMVLDYAELNWLGDFILRNLDHKILNDVFSFEPTAERIAQYLYNVVVVHKPDWLKYLQCIRVSETAKTWAEYSE
jgi:6-pyruvoyltetrahydropterin/6-carboxytetrahydropterin synthase